MENQNIKDSVIKTDKKKVSSQKIIIWVVFAIFLIYAFTLVFPFAEQGIL